MNIELSKEELTLIKGRLEMESEWGESVYTKSELDIMFSIIYKIAKTLNK